MISAGAGGSEADSLSRAVEGRGQAAIRSEPFWCGKAIDGIDFERDDRSEDRSKTRKAFQIGAVGVIVGNAQSFFLNGLDMDLVEFEQVQFALQKTVSRFRKNQRFQELSAGFSEKV